MRVTHGWLVIASFAVGTAFTIVSCTDVVEPTRTLVPGARFVEGPLPHGIAYTVRAPSTNDFPAGGGVPWAATGASLLPAQPREFMAAVNSLFV